MSESRCQGRIFLRLDGINEDDAGVAAVGVAGGNATRSFLQLYVTNDFVSHRGGFSGELFVAFDGDAGFTQPVPGPVALDGEGCDTHPVVQKLALRGERNG